MNTYLFQWIEDDAAKHATMKGRQFFALRPEPMELIVEDNVTTMYLNTWDERPNCTQYVVSVHPGDRFFISTFGVVLAQNGLSKRIC